MFKNLFYNIYIYIKFENKNENNAKNIKWKYLVILYNIFIKL